MAKPRWVESDAAATVQPPPRAVQSYVLSCARKNSIRTPQQQHDHGGKNKECTELRKPVLACGVGNAENQCGHERTIECSQTADCNHNQYIVELIEGIRWTDRQNFCAQCSTERRKCTTQAKRENEKQIGTYAQGLCHSSVVYRSAQLGAQRGFLEQQSHRAKQDEPCHDQHGAV